MSKKQKKIDRISSQYYENNKERFQELAQNKYRELSNEEKDIRRKYVRNRLKLNCQCLRNSVFLEGQPWLGSKGEILKNWVPRWLENAILGLFLTDQEYFKS